MVLRYLNNGETRLWAENIRIKLLSPIKYQRGSIWQLIKLNSHIKERISFIQLFQGTNKFLTDISKYG